mgnify:CR=1 FL=1
MTCFYCGGPKSDAHHAYMRRNSEVTVPLCRICHEKAHQQSTFLKYLRQVYERQSSDSYYHRLNLGR